MTTSFFIWWLIGWFVANLTAYMAEEMDGMSFLDTCFVLIITVIIWPVIIAAWMADVSKNLKAIRRRPR